MLIFGGVATSTSKRKDKLTLREIMAAKPTTLRYLDWYKYLIQFTMEDQWTRFSNANRYPFVLNPTIARVQLTEVLIDGGAGLNIIFASTLKKMGLNFVDLLTPTDVPFYGLRDITREGGYAPRAGYFTRYLQNIAQLQNRVHQA